MIILGVNQSHDAGAAIIKDDKIISVINEERLNGVKCYWGFPYKAIDAVIKHSGIHPSQIDKVAIANLSMVGAADGASTEERIKKIYKENNPEFGKKMMYHASNYSFVESMAFAKFCLLAGRLRSVKKLANFKKYLHKKGINAQVKLVEHHHAHICSAYLTSPFKESLAYTSDFMGDFLSGTVYECNPDEIKRIKEIPFYVAPGMVYGWITYHQ